MSTLGKYFHDFPRLAKQSGYNFQLHRDKVNWIDLEKVDIQDIIDNRNLKMLEQNLIHVINYDLEKECDVKFLDQNFVKLFKLAQLGIDYLSYCELYLDRCVILLQEQLTSYQEKCILLKEEIEKKDEELKRSKMKIRIQSQNCKCSKCDKIFLNEAYLKSHEKRRHGNAQPSFETKVLKDETQQTETETEKENKTVSSSTQTTENTTSLPANESITKDGTDLLKLNEQELKIDGLKKDLEELKTRLNLAEKTIEEKRNDDKTFQTNFPNAVIPIIHSYLSPERNGYVQVPGTPSLVPNLPKHVLIQEDATEKCETLKNGNTPQIQSGSSNRSTARHVNAQQASVIDVTETTEESNRSHVYNESISPKTHGSDRKASLQSPPQRLNTTDLRPIFPGEESQTEKAKKTEIELEIEDIINDFENDLPNPSVLLSDDAKAELDTSNEDIQLKTSTPFKNSVSLKKWDATLGSVQDTPPRSNRRKSKSEETLIQTINQDEEPEKSKSLLKKIMTKKPPKIQELKTNFKNSFSQLCESVSSSKKSSDGEERKSRLDVVEGLHNRLKELGVDPDWSGIPKETMKQKLNILEHHRNLLSKENRLYPFLRRKLEKHVLKKIQSNSFSLKKKPDESKEEPTPSKSNVPTKSTFPSESSEITLFDSDVESDVEVLDKGKVVKSSPPTPGNAPSTTKAHAEGVKKKEEERESTDFSIFQASKFKGVKPQIIELKVPDEVLNKANNGDADLQADSDFDFELFEEQSMQSISQHMAEKDLIASFPQKKDNEPELLNFRNGVMENLGILKGDADNRNLAKKKVLFADDPVILETGSKTVLKNTADKKTASKMNPALDDDDDDDDWSIESEWTVNTKL